MATKQAAVDDTRQNVVSVEWIINDGDDGEPYEIAYLPDHTVHTFGTFGAGGEITWEGNNQNPPGAANWVTLNNFDSTLLVHTGKAAGLVAENMRFIRPRASAGTGLTITAIVHGFVGRGVSISRP